MKWKIILFVVWVAGVAARASFFTDGDTDRATFARQHVFMVSKDGLCIDPIHQWGWDTNAALRMKPFSVSNSLALIEDGISQWCGKNSKAVPLPARVVVFIHGGMNAYETSRDRLADTNLLNALAASNCYPVFISWDSGPFHALVQHLWSIRQGEKADTWDKFQFGPLTMPLVVVSDLMRGLARLPTTLCGRLYSDWKTTELPNGPQVRSWENFEELVSSNFSGTNPPTFRAAPREHLKRTWGERTIHGVEYILTQPTKIITLPLLDGMGTEAWDIMLRRTRTLFDATQSYEIGRLVRHLDDPNTEPGRNRQATVRAWLSPVDDVTQLASTNYERGAMYFFSQKMAEWSGTNCFGNYCLANPVKFEFYGHSMGTIVLNEMFRKRPDIRADVIAYMAAACSIADFQSALFPYLAAHPDTQFYNLTLHRLRDRDEYPIKLPVPFARDLIVRGSLLNWIDDILAKPNSITDRTLGTWENAVRALPDIPQNLRARTFFRECDLEPQHAWSGGAGIREPQVHGDFTRSVLWSKAFLWPDGTNQMVLRPN